MQHLFPKNSRKNCCAIVFLMFANVSLAFFTATSCPGTLLNFWVQNEKHADCFTMESPVVSFAQMEERD